MKYRVMARMLHERKHHQQGPDYETKAEAEQQARYWDGVGGSIAHVEKVPPARPNHLTGGQHREAAT